MNEEMKHSVRVPSGTFIFRKGTFERSSCIILFVFIFSVSLHFLTNHASTTSHFAVRGIFKTEGPPPWSNLSHLVIVAGHSVFMKPDFSTPQASPSDWYLEPYQYAQLDSFVGHIDAGLRIAGKDPHAGLIFSGGAVRSDAGPRSEGFSYWMWAESHGMAKMLGGIDRAQTEESSRDSFENLLFSVCRFRQLAGHYPNHITVVSLEFKRARFRDLHRAAIRFPAGNFTFVGIGESEMPGEIVNALQPFMRDPYGCQPPVSTKRLARNPFKLAVPFPRGCEEIQALFGYCQTQVYQGPLPWDEARK